MGSPLYQPGRGTKRPQEFLMYVHGYLHTTVGSARMLVCTRPHHVDHYPVGQLKVQEYEVLGGGSGRRLDC